MITGAAKNRSWVWMLIWLILIMATAAIVFAGYLWWKSVATTVPTCQAQDLQLSVNEDADINDVNYVHAILTNSGSEACTLNGYPTVAMLDSNGARLGASDAQYSDAFAPATVTLQPNGGQAYALLGFPNSSAFNSGVCSTKSTTVRMYLPGIVVAPNIKSFTTGLQKEVCPGFSVAVFQPGS